MLTINHPVPLSRFYEGYCTLYKRLSQAERSASSLPQLKRQAWESHLHRKIQNATESQPCAPIYVHGRKHQSICISLKVINTYRKDSSNSTQEQKGMVMGLRHLRNTDALDYQFPLNFSSSRMSTGQEIRHLQVVGTFTLRADNPSPLASTNKVRTSGYSATFWRQFWQMLSRQLRINCLVYSMLPAPVAKALNTFRNSGGKRNDGK